MARKTNKSSKKSVKKTEKEESKKKVARTSGGCPAPLMPDGFFETYPGARWDEGDCIWRDSGGQPIGGG